MNDDFLRSPYIKSVTFKVQIEMKDPKSLNISKLKGYLREKYSRIQDVQVDIHLKKPVDCDFNMSTVLEHMYDGIHDINCTRNISSIIPLYFYMYFVLEAL